MKGTLARLFSTVDSEGDFEPKGLRVKGSERSWCITPPSFGVNRPPKTVVIQKERRCARVDL